MIKKPKKSLGQNFLTAQSVVDKIIETAKLDSKDIVLEIGTGKGILTKSLLEKAKKVISIEKDDELISYLQEKFKDEIKNGKLILVHGDILTFDFEKYGLKNNNYKIVANIPYYITGEFLRSILSSDIQPKSMVLLVQKEVAERIARSKKERLGTWWGGGFVVGVAVTPRRNPGLGDLTTNSGRVFRTLLFTGTMLVVTPFTFAQSKQTGLPEGELPEESRIIATHEIPEVRLVVVARGLSHPWSLAFLPGGDMLITERGGRLRMVRDGVLVAEPVSGLPTDIDASDFYSGLMDVAIHPEFARNRLVYLTYTRALDRGETVVLVRGRLEGMALTSVEEIFVASLTGGDPNRPVHDSGSRLAFAPDGTLFMTIGGAFEGDYPGDPKNADLAQNLASHAGKLLRLNADGSPPDDNPFVDEADSLPEIYSLRHRNQMGLALHPETGQPFATEHGMQGGDELNAIEPGGNYGWPLVTYGRRYDGRRVERVWQEGLQEPVVFWVPSIAPSGLTFYDGDRFPAWKGNVFTGAMRVGRIARTGHLQRIVLGETGGELRRESLLGEFRQRIRDVRQGPDGLLYLLTDGQDPAGRAYQPALLRLEPVSR